MRSDFLQLLLIAVSRLVRMRKALKLLCLRSWTPILLQLFAEFQNRPSDAALLDLSSCRVSGKESAFLDKASVQPCNFSKEEITHTVKATTQDRESPHIGIYRMSISALKIVL